jgi:hypothetical protein
MQAMFGGVPRGSGSITYFQVPLKLLRHQKRRRVKRRRIKGRLGVVQNRIGKRARRQRKEPRIPKKVAHPAEKPATPGSAEERVDAAQPAKKKDEGKTEGTQTAAAKTEGAKTEEAKTEVEKKEQGKKTDESLSLGEGKPGKPSSKDAA